MKALLAGLALAALPLTASATIVEGTQYNGPLELSYPLVYVDNPVAQQKINTDIASYVEAAKGSYQPSSPGQYDFVHMSYIVPYEDDQVLSIVLRNDNYYTGAAHGYHYLSGLVYNKQTGDRIPLTAYVPLASDTQLRTLIGNGTLVAKDEGENVITPAPDFLNQAKVPTSYALFGQGLVGMFFAPYELGPYAQGEITVYSTPQNIQYIKQLNNVR